jgi:cell wall-associated NlpC family hydrolase
MKPAHNLLDARLRLPVALGLLMLGTACFRGPSTSEVGTRPASPAVRPIPKPLPRVGYTIQVGAFALVDNAARLAESLQAQGLEATYYASAKGLYRVRFGNFPTREAARVKAESLRASGIIQEFYLAAPEDTPLPRPRPEDTDGLRANLVETARSYLGVPYLWGGASAQGFDCSGLTMSVYRLNGLQLPRSSRDQYEAGSQVSRDELRPGDLLFFSTNGTGRVSHVGLYAGDGTFIHAPSRGRTISQAKLSDAYYQKTFVGARTYL